MSRADVMRGLAPSSSGGFLDLESVGMRAADASAPIVPDFAGRDVEVDAGPEIDPVSLEVGGMADAESVLPPTVPQPGVAEFARGLTGIPSAAFNFNMGLADSLTRFGAAAAGGLARVARQVSGGLLDLSGASSPPDARETQLLTAGDPQSVAAGERLRDQRMRADAAGRAGFALSIRDQRNVVTPGVDADSWSYFGGSLLGSVIPSAGALANPVTAIPVMASYAAGAYESRYDDYVQKSVEQTGTFDPQKATVLGILSAGVEAALEALPIGFAAKAGQRVIDIASDAALRGSQGWRAAAAKELTTALLGSAAVEGSTEAATELSNALLDLTYDAELQRQVQEDPAGAMREVASRMGEAFMGGALGGVLLGGAGVAAGRPSQRPGEAAPNTLSQSGGMGGQLPLFDPKATPQRFNAQSVSDALDIPFEEGHAVVALADAMGLDKSRIMVQRGGSVEGESLAQGTPRTRGPGLSPPPETAYREPVSKHTDRVYRETSVESALDMLPGGGGIDLAPRRMFVANTPDLAIGQGANRGVLMEFDASNLEGQINTAKPGWQAAWTGGHAEFELSYNQTGAYRNALRSVSIKPDAMADKVSRARMQRAIAQLVARGWTRENLDGGGVRLSRPETLSQSDKGTVTFREDGTALIRGLAGSDVSTGIHEVAHVARRQLFDRSVPAAERAGITDTDIATGEEWAGAADGVWTVAAEEKFARGLERYIRDGKAPSKRLESLFAKLRTWMVRLYRSIAGSPIDIQISEPMRQVFDHLVSRGNVLKVPLRDVYSSAVGEGYAETRPDIPERLPRVARPEAIELLRANGLWPEGETPDDIALSLVTDARMAPVLTGLLAKTKLSRSDATALFGDRPEMQKDDARAAWLNALRGLAEDQGFVPVTVTDERILDIPPTQPRQVPDPEDAGVDPVFFRQGALLEFRRRVQDELIKWEKMENDVAPEDMFSAGSPTGLMRTASSAVASARLEFRERFGKFLADLSMHRITAERLYRYMMAQHAQEANQAAARRAPDNPDVAYGFTDDAAKAHLAVESRAPDFAILEEMADRARAFDAEIFEMAYDGGLITDAQYSAMSQYQKYTRTMDDPDFTASIEEEVALAERKRFSVGRKQYEKRTGRTQASLDDPTDARAKAIAENGLARMVENFERKIGRVANNRIGNAIRKWAAKNPASRGSVSVVAEPPMVDAIRDGETQRVPDHEYGNRPNVLSFRMDEDGFIGGKLVRRGETFYVEIADMPTAIAMKSATELTDGGYKLLRAILRTATNIVRVGATGAPSLTFGFARNWPRDIQSSRIVMTTHERYGVDQSIRRRWKKNLLPAMRALVAQQWRGEIPANPHMAMRLKEWERSGGKLEFVGPADYLKAQNLVRHALDPTAKTRLAASHDAFVNFLRRVNSPMESFTKFAYFVTLRDSGIDEQKAAVLSRDLIDYGKRGASTGFLRDAKAFFNAHIQGVERQITSLGTRQGKQAQAFIMALGFAQGMMEYWIYGPDIDGTGEEDWEEETEFEKRTTVQIPAIFSEEGPTGVVKVPLDHSLVLSHASGRAIAESITGGTEVSETFHGLASAALDNFNPFGGSGLIQSPSAAFRGFVPDAALPAFDLTTNTNYRGFPIYDTPFPGQEGSWVRAENPRDETAPAFVSIAQAIQRNTGFDMAPEIMPYMLNYLFGGGGRDVSQLVGLATAPFTEEGFSEITTSDIPIVRALARQGAARSVVANDYYTLKAKTQKYLADLERAIERGNMQSAIEIAEQNPALDRASREIQQAENALRTLRRTRSELRTARDGAVDSGDYETASASRAALLDLKRAMREVRAAALRRVRTPPQAAGGAQAAPAGQAAPQTPVGTAP